MYVQFCNAAKSCAYWLVNETLRYETETFGNYVWRPSRDRDVETETTSLLQCSVVKGLSVFPSVNADQEQPVPALSGGNTLSTEAWYSCHDELQTGDRDNCSWVSFCTL